ncbi:MAG: hypothetical protein LBL85_04270, partial [Methanocalculaceae archaeon]|nr:hypothetical protein [Methanocalculaceae archaeon]
IHLGPVFPSPLLDDRGTTTYRSAYALRKSGHSQNTLPVNRTYSTKLNRIFRTSGTYRIDPVIRRSLIHFHSFRKFFLTEFKLSASAEVAEELAGITDIHEEMQRITNELKQIRTEYRLLCTRISAESVLPEE